MHGVAPRVRVQADCVPAGRPPREERSRGRRPRGTARRRRARSGVADLRPTPPAEARAVDPLRIAHREEARLEREGEPGAYGACVSLPPRRRPIAASHAGRSRPRPAPRRSQTRRCTPRATPRRSSRRRGSLHLESLRLQGGSMRSRCNVQVVCRRCVTWGRRRFRITMRCFAGRSPHVPVSTSARWARPSVARSPAALGGVLRRSRHRAVALNVELDRHVSAAARRSWRMLRGCHTAGGATAWPPAGGARRSSAAGASSPSMTCLHRGACGGTRRRRSAPSARAAAAAAPPAPASSSPAAEAHADGAPRDERDGRSVYAPRRRPTTTKAAGGGGVATGGRRLRRSPAPCRRRRLAARRSLATFAAARAPPRRRRRLRGRRRRLLAEADATQRERGVRPAGVRGGWSRAIEPPRRRARRLRRRRCLLPPPPAPPPPPWPTTPPTPSAAASPASSASAEPPPMRLRIVPSARRRFSASGRRDSRHRRRRSRAAAAASASPCSALLSSAADARCRLPFDGSLPSGASVIRRLWRAAPPRSVAPPRAAPTPSDGLSPEAHRRSARAEASERRAGRSARRGGGASPASPCRGAAAGGRAAEAASVNEAIVRAGAGSSARRPTPGLARRSSEAPGPATCRRRPNLVELEGAPVLERRRRQPLEPPCARDGSRQSTSTKTDKIAASRWLDGHAAPASGRTAECWTCRRRAAQCHGSASARVRRRT